MKDFLKKYSKSIFATASILGGISPSLDVAIKKATVLLNSAGLDWSQVLSAATGATNLSLLIPVAAVATLPYLIKIMHPTEKDSEVIKEETRKMVKELMEEMKNGD